MSGFIPAGHKPLAELRDEIGVDELGSELAAGRLKAYRVNARGELVRVETSLWRSEQGSKIMAEGCVRQWGGRFSGWEVESVLVEWPPKWPHPWHVPNDATSHSKRAPNGENISEAQLKKPHRPRGTGLDRLDAPLIERMRQSPATRPAEDAHRVGRGHRADTRATASRGHWLGDRPFRLAEEAALVLELIAGGGAHRDPLLGAHQFNLA
jgi:hypothetical protein